MDRALVARVEKQTWFHRYPRGWPFLLFVLASLGTIVGVMALERADQQRREVELDRNMTEIASGIQRRAAENVTLLRAGSVLFQTADDVSAVEFSDFVVGVQSDGQTHGALGMGWARMIKTSDLLAFEEATRKRLHSDYFVFPKPGPDQRLAVPIVQLVPPTATNRSVVGFDMYSDETRRQAIDKSIKLASPVATGKLRLMQGSRNGSSAGFIIYMPVFMQQDGRKIVKGFVYSPFYASEFLASAAGLYRDRDVDIAIYDGDPVPANLLTLRRAEGDAGIALSRKISVANRT